MLKRIIVFAVIMLFALQGAAFAQEMGNVVFNDALYGAAIGGIIGLAVYLIDQDDLGAKLGAGVVVGTVGGLIYGLSETRSFVEIEDDEVRLAMPSIKRQKRGEGTIYQADLVRVSY